MMTNKTLNVSNNFQVALLNFNSTTTMYMYQLLTNRLCQRYSSSKCLPHLMKIGKLSSYIVVWCILYMVPMSSIDILDPCKKLFFLYFTNWYLNTIFLWRKLTLVLISKVQNLFQDLQMKVVGYSWFVYFNAIYYLQCIDIKLPRQNLKKIKLYGSFK